MIYKVTQIRFQHGQIHFGTYTNTMQCGIVRKWQGEWGIVVVNLGSLTNNCTFCDFGYFATFTDCHTSPLTIISCVAFLHLMHRMAGAHVCTFIDSLSDNFHSLFCIVGPFLHFLLIVITKSYDLASSCCYNCYNLSRTIQFVNYKHSSAIDIRRDCFCLHNACTEVQIWHVSNFVKSIISRIIAT